MVVAAVSAHQRPVTGSPDAIEALLRELVDGQRQIIRLLKRQQQRPTSTLSREDRSTLARLLPAIGGVYGSDQFSSRDLAEDTRPAVRLVVRGWSVKRISKLFARADGISSNGLMVQKQGVKFQVTVWQIVGSGSL